MISDSAGSRPFGKVQKGVSQRFTQNNVNDVPCNARPAIIIRIEF